MAHAGHTAIARPRGEEGARPAPLAAERGPRRRRGWLVRRALLAADLVGLVAAFLITQFTFGEGLFFRASVLELFVFFLVSLPLWVLAAKLYGLYERDEERTDHSTTDDVVRVFHLVTVGVWVLYAGAWLTDLTTPQLRKTVFFWALAIVLITSGRSLGRSLVRRSASYVQNAIVVGDGEVGQLVGLKYLQHPEYGIRLLGLADDQPRPRREELAGFERWSLADVLEVVRERDVDRVVIAFSGEASERLLDLVRELRQLEVQIDVVPRLFEVIGPNVDLHSVEGIPLLGLPPAKLSRSSRLVKRGLDVVGASLLLVLASPLLAAIAVWVRRDSPGPVLFRQTRLGEDMREFTALKFRTMTVGSHDAAHRDYVRSIMSTSARAETGGLYKLERPDAVTRSGRWLRRTSLDELPQLLNVVKGDMSLVGPRPCLAYETELFEPHHFERFLVPAGITGLWQVTARARSTFAEALEMDVAYARGWSLGLDLRILLRTPLQVFRRRGAA